MYMHKKCAFANYHAVLVEVKTQEMLSFAWVLPGDSRVTAYQLSSEETVLISITPLCCSPQENFSTLKKNIMKPGTSGSCLTPVILAIWEVEIRRIKVGGQPGQLVRETLSPN
jgi:hypothetical protein